MYNFLQFIDSQDIREYNKDASFTPAEQAVLISRSRNTSILEKLDALKYLIEMYTDEEFRSNSVWCVYGCNEGKDSFKTVALRTVSIWENILEDRYNNDGVVFEVKFDEREHSEFDMRSYGLFSCYEKAYEKLLEQKQKYLGDEDLKNVKTYGKIYRIPIDDCDECICGDVYLYDNKMELARVYGADIRMQNGMDSASLIDDYEMFLPLPFKPGDIVKVEWPFGKTYYGVFSYEWKKREVLWTNNMMVSLNIWDDEKKAFDYTDGSDILGLSYCSDEELPESQKVLKAIRDVRKGKTDFYTMLYYYEQGELEGIISQ